MGKGGDACLVRVERRDLGGVGEGRGAACLVRVERWD